MTEKGKDLVKRQKLIEGKVEEIKDLKNQLTDKDKEHDGKIKALTTKLKTVEKTVTVMKTEIKQQKPAPVHEEKKPFKCEICDATFTSNQILEGHVISDHEASKKRKVLTSDENEQPKRFSCEICDASFSQNGGLTRHIKTIHAGIKSPQV